MSMNRKDAIVSAMERLSSSLELMGLLLKFGKVRVFPVDCEDYVTFSIEEVPVLLAKYQNVKERTCSPPPATP